MLQNQIKRAIITAPIFPARKEEIPGKIPDLSFIQHSSKCGGCCIESATI
jgi:hypothetical protein